LKRLRAATVEEVQEVPGIGPATAAVIVATLHRPADQATTVPAVNVATGEILDDEPPPAMKGTP
jgi:excinuclease ABC subunit C